MYVERRRVKMSFLNINEPKKRDAIVAAYLATVKRIKNRNLQERAKDFIHHETIEQSLQPVVNSTAASTEAITKQLVPIKEGITALNTRLQQQHQQQQQMKEEKEKEEEEEEGSNMFEQLVGATSDDKLDDYFGIVRSNEGGYQMGNQKIEVDKNDIIVGGTTRYKGTTGLWMLIMFKKPDERVYTQDDFQTYQKVIEQTDAMTEPNNVRANSKIKSTYKWRTLFKKFGGHAAGDGIVEFLPSNIKTLQTKLRYLLGEFRAGNSSATRNEIVAIADELLRRKRISRKKYKDINNFLVQQ